MPYVIILLSPQPPNDSFQGSAVSALSLQSVYLLSGLLTAKMLGAAQVLRRGRVKQASTGFHPTRVSENKNGQKSFNELLMI